MRTRPRARRAPRARPEHVRRVGDGGGHHDRDVPGARRGDERVMVVPGQDQPHIPFRARLEQRVRVDQPQPLEQPRGRRDRRMVQHHDGPVRARLGENLPKPREPDVADRSVAGPSHGRVDRHDPEAADRENPLPLSEHLLEGVREVVVPDRVRDRRPSFRRPGLQPLSQQPVRRRRPVVGQVAGHHHQVHRLQFAGAHEHPIERFEGVDQPVLEAAVAVEMRVAEVEDPESVGHAAHPSATVRRQRGCRRLSRSATAAGRAACGSASSVSPRSPTRAARSASTPRGRPRPPTPSRGCRRT